MLKRILISLLLLGELSYSFGQDNGMSIADYQKAYLNGRDLYNLGKYNLAMEAFKPLTGTPNPFAEYASFFYALSAYNNGNKELSKSMFMQIARKYQDWNKMDEINLWLEKINFENRDYFQGMHYFNQIISKDARKNGNNMKDHYFKQETDTTILENLLKEFPEEREIATALAFQISNQPLSQIDFGRLTQLVEKYDLDPEKYKLFQTNKVIKKDEYNIGVLLPFMFDELQPQRGRWSNQFILDLYEGMRYGKEELESMGIKVNLYAFDTKRDSTTTAKLAASGQLNNMDVLVGPLYTGPSKVIWDYSFEHSINMINPLSNNSEVTGANPFSFLYQPASQTLAESAAAYVHGKFENKNAAIFFGDSQQDSVMASEYRHLIEADSFKVVIYKRIPRSETRQIFETLMATYEVDDSLDVDPESNKLELLVIKPDSIGHIFTASNDGLFGSTMISTIESRGDTIPLIGTEEWLNLRSIDYNVVSKLGVSFLAPNYFELPNEHFEKFRKNYLDKNYELPTRNIQYGYNLALFLGINMKAYGKYFQAGARKGDLQPGYLRTGFRIGQWNDDAWIPVIQVKDGGLIWINKQEMMEPSKQ